MDVQADPQAGSGQAGSGVGDETLVWVRHCACGRMRGVFPRAADASNPAVVSACDNCGRYESTVSPARRDGAGIRLRVCTRCASIVYEPPASGAATCPCCRRGELVERTFEPPARLMPPGRL